MSVSTVSCVDNVSFQKHMDAGTAKLLNLAFDDAIGCFDAAIALDPSSSPKQWMRGIALFFCQRYDEGEQQFMTNLETENPNDAEEALWACMCNMKRLGVDNARSLLLPYPEKDSRVPMREIYHLFAGTGNVADVLHAACCSIDGDRKSNNDDPSPTAYAHLYVALYLDCLTQSSGVGLSEASRRHYVISGNAPSNDFMGKLSTALSKFVIANNTSTINSKESSDKLMIRQTFPDAPSYDYSSSLVGCWQLSSGHHNDSPTKDELHQRLTANIQLGFSTLDMGDIYTGVEAAVGVYISENPNAASVLQIHTKLVPDFNLLSTWSKDHTTNIVRRSINRLRYFQRLDLVQFHWWDWNIGNHVKAYRGLCSLVPSMIKSVGVTNYDAKHLKDLLAAGLPVVSNQVQYSLIDRRAETMLDACTKHNVRLLCYGCLAGGFLSDRWLHKEDPVPSSIVKIDATVLTKYLTNRSLIKYYLIIREFGGWSLFQELLTAIRTVANRYNSNIATVAQAWVLSRRRVGGVIIGLSGIDKHLQSASSAHQLAWLLDEKDDKILSVVLDKSQGPTGPFYSIERVRDSLHGQIMRYNCGELYTKIHADEFVRRVQDLTTSTSSTAPTRRPEEWLIESMLLEARGFDEEVRGGMLATSIEALDSWLPTTT